MKSLSAFIILYVAFSLISKAQETVINSEELLNYIKVLSSDSLEGRKAGSAGDKKATQYIISQFSKNGINIPDSMIQTFDIITDIKTGNNNKLLIDQKTFVLNKDYKPLYFSASKTLSTEVCFAGYGFHISEASLKWDDYKGLDVKNKWVIIFRADPEIDNADSKFIPYSSERSKVITAKDMGASGIIFISGKTVEEKDVLMNDFFDKTAKDEGIPVINITRKVADEIFSKVEKTTNELEEFLNKNRKPNSFDIPVKIEAETDLIQVKAQTNNILAFLPGNDKTLKNEFIVIGAHYDHLGYGGPNSGSRMPDTLAIHHGADDNASGSSAIIELAKLFKNNKSNKRSILFIAFAGEEMGLLGSKYFITHPVIDKTKIKAMINIDMIGRFNKEKNKLEIGGTGTASVFDSIIDVNAKDYSFSIQKSQDGYGPSDHASFYSEKIPVIFITTGAHTDYHTPFDTWDKINIQDMSTITEFIYKLSTSICNYPKGFSYIVTGTKKTGRYGRRLKVTFGIIPDVANTDVDGLSIIGVRKGGHAEQAGMQSKDIITAINGKKISNIYEYMHRLNTLKTGETVNVEINRNGEKLVLLLQL